MKVIYPGSFDPPTNGHLDIVKRASGIFENLEVVIADNPRKQYTFSAEERFEMITTMVADFANVQVTIWRGLIVARREGPAYVWRVLDYVTAAESQARVTAHSGLDPQIRLVSGWAGAKAAMRVLISGPGALPDEDEETTPV